MGTPSAKKIAAAVAAVVQYLAEVEITAAVPLAAPEPASLPAPVYAAAPWGMAGRQESMALRDLWQRRIPKSW